MRNHAHLLVAGCIAQMEKLKENDHKNGFDNIDIEYATRRIHDEYVELSEETGYPKDQTDYSAIRREAADVANFAHMIILSCDKELEI